MIAGHHPHDEAEREGPLGTWFRATGPDGSAGGLLRFAEDAPLKQVVAVTRVLRELHLPGVLPITDLVRQRGRAWLVVALPPGPTLADRLAGDVPDPAHAAAILDSTAETLLAMHAAGVVHGAVGAEAVVLGEDGVARLADWGVAGTAEGDVVAWAQLAHTLAWACGGELSRYAELALTAGLAAALDELRGGAGSEAEPVGDETAMELPWTVPPVPEAPRSGADSVDETTPERPGSVPSTEPAPDREGSMFETALERPDSVPPVPSAAEFRGGHADDGDAESMYVTAPERPGSIPSVPASTESGQQAEAAPTAETQRGARRSDRIDALAAGSDVRRFGPGVPDLAAPSRAEEIWRGGAAKRSRRRRRLASLGLTLLIVGAAIVVGLWLRQPAELTITGVEVRTEPRGPGCDGTAVITGLISTNGGAGEIEYRWVRSDGPQPEPPPRLQISRQPDVQVALEWPFTGQRTAEYTARLEVLSPQQIGAEKRFVYSCP